MYLIMYYQYFEKILRYVFSKLSKYIFVFMNN
uniref:Uncharacterized protein n=1 Tax=viral metagenome TaxID=1070528 RepID=A0A6C0LSF2_9ZZZZ